MVKRTESWRGNKTVACEVTIIKSSVELKWQYKNFLKNKSFLSLIIFNIFCGNLTFNANADGKVWKKDDPLPCFRWPEFDLAITRANITGDYPPYKYEYSFMVSAKDSDAGGGTPLCLRLLNNPDDIYFVRDEFGREVCLPVRISERIPEYFRLPYRIAQDFNRTDFPSVYTYASTFEFFYPPGIGEFAIDFGYEDALRKLMTYLPKTEILFYYGNYSSYEFMKAMKKRLYYRDFTLVPFEPHLPISAFIARLMAWVEQARNLRWIKSDKHLNEIKKLVILLNTEEEETTNEATKKIEQYLATKETQENLTAEAIALLRYNALSLRNRFWVEDKVEH
ncbi:MAG: hypothetical protein HY401_10550 [Elusimicrobia bacterium]|nr:hypothetical protein [Elusimicrobiota bacterium]